VTARAAKESGCCSVTSMTMQIRWQSAGWQRCLLEFHPWQAWFTRPHVFSNWACSLRRAHLTQHSAHSWAVLHAYACSLRKHCSDRARQAMEPPGKRAPGQQARSWRWRQAAGPKGGLRPCPSNILCFCPVSTFLAATPAIAFASMGSMQQLASGGSTVLSSKI
jgi:hypothetical protein